MRTATDHASCWHPDLDTETTETSDGAGRLLRVDVDIMCRDCDTVLQRTIHTLPIGEAK